MLKQAIDILDGDEEKGDNKKYLLLYYAEDNGEEIKSFEYITGRNSLYEYIKAAILEYDLDPHRSTIMLLREDGSSTKANSVFSIFHYFKLKGFYEEDAEFDIDDYAEFETDEIEY